MKDYFDPEIQSLVLAPKTRQELADEYRITTRTLYDWLKEAKLRIPRGLISPLYQRIIYSIYGIPPNLKQN